MLKRQKRLKEHKQIVATKTVVPNFLPPVTTNNDNENNNNKKNKIQRQSQKKPKTVYPPCETCGKTNQSTERWYFGANAANKPAPRHKRPKRQNQAQQRDSRTGRNDSAQAADRKKNRRCRIFNPEL